MPKMTLIAWRSRLHLQCPDTLEEVYRSQRDGNSGEELLTPQRDVISLEDMCTLQSLCLEEEGVLTPQEPDSPRGSPGQVVSLASLYCTDELEERLPTTQRILTGEEEEESAALRHPKVPWAGSFSGYPSLVSLSFMLQTLGFPGPSCSLFSLFPLSTRSF